MDEVGLVDVLGLEVIIASPDTFEAAGSQGRLVLKTLDRGDVSLLLLGLESSPESSS